MTRATTRDPEQALGLVPHARCARLLDVGLEERRVQFGEDLAFAHLGVEIGLQRHDGPGDLRAGLDGRDGLERFRGVDGADNIAVRDLRCRDVRALGGAGAAVVLHYRRDDNEGGDDDPEACAHAGSGCMACAGPRMREAPAAL